MFSRNNGFFYCHFFIFNGGALDLYRYWDAFVSDKCVEWVICYLPGVLRVSSRCFVRCGLRYEYHEFEFVFVLFFILKCAAGGRRWCVVWIFVAFWSFIPGMGNWILLFSFSLQRVPMPNFTIHRPVKTLNAALDSCFRLVRLGGVSKVEKNCAMCLSVSFQILCASMAMSWYCARLRAILISTYVSLSNGEILSSVGKTIKTIEFAIRFDVLFLDSSDWCEHFCDRRVWSMTTSLFDSIVVVFCHLSVHWSRWWVILR